MLIPRSVLAVVALGLSVLAVAASPTPAGAACAAPSSKVLAGTVQGEDGRFVSSQVSIELFTASGTKIGMDGCPMGGGYATTVLVNEKSSCCFILPGSGSDSSPYFTSGKNWPLEKTWQASGLPANADHAWIEVYSKRSGGSPNTDTSRYGHALRRPIAVGNTSVDVKLPLRCGVSNNGVTGSTGGIRGAVYDNGVKVTPSRVGTWTTDGDSEARILGWGLASRSSAGYDVDQLAPGGYTVVVTANGVTKQLYGVRVSPCSTTVFDVAVRGSVPKPSDIPVIGDWDGDGDEEPGVFRSGTWILKTDAGESASALPTFRFGTAAGDHPVVGDWDGDGDDEPAIHRTGGDWFLRNDSSTTGDWTTRFNFGSHPSDHPVAGDWDGDGDDEPAVHRTGGDWFLRNDSSTTGRWTTRFNFGSHPSDHPVAGDWDGDGDDEPAVHRTGGDWFLRNDSSTTGRWTTRFNFGRADADLPISGDWDRDGRSEPVIHRTGLWYLHDGGQVATSYRFPS